MMPALRRLRGALVVGLVWGGAWAVVGGAIMEGIVDPRGAVVDMWPQLLGMVGFLGGVIFAGLVGLAGRRRSLDEFSHAEFAGLGALAGVLQGALAMLLFGAPALFTAVTLATSALAAVGSLGVVRWAGARRLAGGDTARDELSRGGG